MLFVKDYVQNSKVARDQLHARDEQRNAANAQELTHQPTLKAMKFDVNAGRIPQEVYKEFDNVTIKRLRSDDGDTFLNDLMPLSRGVSIGKLMYENRKASDAGLTQTSMSGQTGIKFDQVEYNYDGTLVPMHDAGFSRNFRELDAQRSEGFDSLIDDQRETAASIRRRLADSFLDGHKDTSGEFIDFKGVTWKGMRNDDRVAQVNLGGGGINFDFTSESTTGIENLNALIKVLNVLYIDNLCEKDVTLYISREIMRNWERLFFNDSSSNMSRIIDRITLLSGVGAIKTTNKLTGNQMMAFPLDGESVRPITGMGISTYALPRPLYNSNHEFITACAVGWMVNVDYFKRTCALYAAG